MATRYLRQGDGWVREDAGGLSAVLEIPSLDCRLALHEVYEGVPFL
ncbi:MAG: hypothetical protein ACKVX9_14105 [Blastocatellia bacterium]